MAVSRSCKLWRIIFSGDAHKYIHVGLGSRYLTAMDGGNAGVAGALTGPGARRSSKNISPQLA